MPICASIDNRDRIRFSGDYDPTACDLAVMTTGDYENYLRLSETNQETLFQCPGEVSYSDRQTLVCSVSWQQTTASFNPATLDPGMIAGAVGLGFFILVPLWAAATGVKHLLEAIPNKI